MDGYGRAKRLPDRLDKLRRRILRRPQEMIVHAASAHAGAVGTMPVRDKTQPFGRRCCRGAHLVNTQRAGLTRWWNVVAKLRWARQSFPL
jgi:hypothetical protein